jgi:hypothetical protein
VADEQEEQIDGVKSNGKAPADDDHQSNIRADARGKNRNDSQYVPGAPDERANKLELRKPSVEATDQ